MTEEVRHPNQHVDNRLPAYWPSWLPWKRLNCFWAQRYPQFSLFYVSPKTLCPHNSPLITSLFNKAAWTIQIENMKRSLTLTEWCSTMFEMGKAIPGGVLVVKEWLLRTLLASRFEAWTHPSPETKAHICIENLQFCADFLLLIDVHVHLGERVRVSTITPCFSPPSIQLTYLTSSNLYFALYNGGPQTFAWSILIAYAGALAQSASLAEMASTQPIAGAQYHWTHALAPTGAKRFITWIQGDRSLTPNQWMADLGRLGDLVGLDIPTSRCFQFDGDHPPEPGCAQWPVVCQQAMAYCPANLRGGCDRSACQYLHLQARAQNRAVGRDLPRLPLHHLHGRPGGSWTAAATHCRICLHSADCRIWMERYLRCLEYRNVDLHLVLHRFWWCPAYERRSTESQACSSSGAFLDDCTQRYHGLRHGPRPFVCFGFTHWCSGILVSSLGHPPKSYWVDQGDNRSGLWFIHHFVLCRVGQHCVSIPLDVGLGSRWWIAGHVCICK